MKTIYTTTRRTIVKQSRVAAPANANAGKPASKPIRDMPDGGDWHTVSVDELRGLVELRAARTKPSIDVFGNGPLVIVDAVVPLALARQFQALVELAAH